MKRFRVGIVTNSGLTIGKSFDTKEKADEWILKMFDEKAGIKLFRILDRKIGLILEDEKGKRGKRNESKKI